MRGTATLTTEGGKELIGELPRKCTGKDYGEFGNDREGGVRVIVRITPGKAVSGSDPVPDRSWSGTAGAPRPAAGPHHGSVPAEPPPRESRRGTVPRPLPW